MVRVSGDNDLRDYRSLEIWDNGSIVEGQPVPTTLQVGGLSPAKYGHCGG